MAPSAQPVNWRRLAVHAAQVVIEQVDVATSDLKRRGAVPEDPLQREDIAPVGKE
jgi:hypothetical protein